MSRRRRWGFWPGLGGSAATVFLEPWKVDHPIEPHVARACAPRHVALAPMAGNVVERSLGYWVRTRLYNYVAAIQSSVLSQCSSAVFELLWPMDVNDPDNGKLMRYINLPSQWTTRAGSGFDTFLIEGYQYPGINHDLDHATRCAKYPWTELAWDEAHCRYLMGLYYATWLWMREFVNVNRLGPSNSGLTTTSACSHGQCRCPRATIRSFIY